MNSAMALELVGYLGSVLVLISMLMTSVVRLRVINLIGSAVFTTYAILIRSYPTAFLNGCLVGVNIYQLLRLSRSAGKSYDFRPVGGGESFPAWFLERYRDDIARYFPAVDLERAKRAEGYAVFYDDQAAGVLLGQRNGENFEILLDYSTPSFRDCSLGAYLYGVLPGCGVARLSCDADTPAHVAYMEKMGFVRREDGSYVKELA